MYGIYVPIRVAINKAINACIEPLELVELDVGREILRLHMKACRNGQPHFLCNLNDLHSKRKGKHRVNVINARKCLANDLFICICNRYANLCNVCIKCFSKMHIRHNVNAVLSLFVLVGAKNANGVSSRFQKADQVHSGNGRAIVFITQNVTYN